MFLVIAFTIPMSEEDQLFSESDIYDNEADDSGDDTFRVRGALSPPRAQPWSTASLHDAMHAGFIDVNPPYQRDVVWPETKQIGLIDSIFRNFYIPPVIFTVEKDQDGVETRVCVDGKQRLTSIQRFIDGMSISLCWIIKKYWYTRSDSQHTRLLLPEAYRKQFQNKQITCVEYTDLPPGTERDIFQRVQLGMSLTVAEKLQAVSSPRAEWVSTLQAMFVNSEGGLSDTLHWVVSRGRDFQGVAQLCYSCWNLPNFSTPTVSKLEKWLVAPGEPSTQFKMQVQQVLEKFIDLGEYSSDNYRKGFTGIKERVAPVEFLFIGILLAKMRNCNSEDCAEKVLAMRKHTRSLHKDVRSNERVMKSMWEYIERLEISGGDPFADWEGPGAETVVTIKKSKTITTKRKRKTDDDDGEVVMPKAPRAPAKPRAKVQKLRSSYGNGVQFVA
ncbi:hypothetical protein BU17DRAFT_52702 [Hysterangium stoloniferum]|nr:hypothetical protein BU17DRAFT_52702 [Hysterangium stoloniferum]